MARVGKPFAQRLKLLRELLIMLFFSVQPPDRGVRRSQHTHTCVIRPYPGLICLFGGRTVGIVRRLRYGQSIKPNGDGYDLDLSKMRFKNSKF